MHLAHLVPWRGLLVLQVYRNALRLVRTMVRYGPVPGNPALRIPTAGDRRRTGSPPPIALLLVTQMHCVNYASGAVATSLS